MIDRHSPQGSFVNDLADKVSCRHVVGLGMEEIVDVEHHLCQQPISWSVQRCINQIAACVRLDGQGKEIPSQIDVVVSSTSSRPCGIAMSVVCEITVVNYAQILAWFNQTSQRIKGEW